MVMATRADNIAGKHQEIITSCRRNNRNQRPLPPGLPPKILQNYTDCRSKVKNLSPRVPPLLCAGADCRLGSAKLVSEFVRREAPLLFPAFSDIFNADDHR